jgi:hypothetical protein
VIRNQSRRSVVGELGIGVSEHVEFVQTKMHYACELRSLVGLVSFDQYQPESYIKLDASHPLF